MQRVNTRGGMPPDTCDQRPGEPVAARRFFGGFRLLPSPVDQRWLSRPGSSSKRPLRAPQPGDARHFSKSVKIQRFRTLYAGGMLMNPTASTVGAYLRDLPPDRRVAMARLCSMIRRSARGVRESMRYGLAFYELDGPLFALESGRRHMSLYVAEKDVVLKHKDALQGVNANKSFIKFSDLNRLAARCRREDRARLGRRPTAACLPGNSTDPGRTAAALGHQRRSRGPTGDDGQAADREAGRRDDATRSMRWRTRCATQ